MTGGAHGSAIGSSVPIGIPSLPRPPASAEPPGLERDGRRPPTGAARILTLGSVGVLSAVLGGLLGATLLSSAPAAARADRARPAGPAIVRALPTPDLTGAERAERAISAILAAAPACTPEIRMAGAPASERAEFTEEAERMAAEASGEQGLSNVRWKVIERDGRLFGVLYAERCE
jgi:hypothetical protein